MRFQTLLIALMGVVCNSYGYYEDPHQSFPTSKNTTNKTTVTWESVDDVQAACEKGSHKRGYGGFNYPVEACSFWNNSSCHVITAKRVNFHTLGHEIRHCFQGDFHKGKTS
jgi:hypothetical protein